MTKMRIPDRSFYPAPLGSILSIWAHPDDETYLAAGVMAAARDRGQRVVCVSATAGENGTPDRDLWPPARLSEVRRWESAAAMAVLGVDEHRIGDFPDGELGSHTAEGVAWVGDLMDEIEPDTILTFGSDGITFHPDHIAVHEWVTRAWEDRGCRSRLLYAAPTVGALEEFGPLYEKWGVYMTEDRPAGVSEERAVVHVALTGQQLDRKMTALRAMATQTGSAIEMLGDATYADLVAEEAFVDALAADALAVSGALRGTPRR
jgi:LmbE family N-acetylglucosaminyl deacetylase